MFEIDTLIVNTETACMHKCRGCYLNESWEDPNLWGILPKTLELTSKCTQHPRPVSINERLSEVLNSGVARTYIISFNPGSTGRYSEVVSQLRTPEGSDLEFSFDFRDLSSFEQSPHRPLTFDISVPPGLLANPLLGGSFLDRVCRLFEKGINPTFNIRAGDVMKLNEEQLKLFSDRVSRLYGIISRIYLIWDKPIQSRDKDYKSTPNYLPIEYWKFQQKLNKTISSFEMKDYVIKTDSCLLQNYRSLKGISSNCGAGLSWANLYLKGVNVWSGCPYGRDYYFIDGDLSLRHEIRTLKEFFRQKGSDFNKACRIKDYITQGEK